MTAENFCYWLQGFFEIAGSDMGTALTGHQSDLIRRHLQLVFVHDIDPKAGGPDVQKKLNEIHSPTPTQPPFSPWCAEGVSTVGHVDKTIAVRC